MLGGIGRGGGKGGRKEREGRVRVRRCRMSRFVATRPDVSHSAIVVNPIVPESFSRPESARWLCSQQGPGEGRGGGGGGGGGTSGRSNRQLIALNTSVSVISSLMLSAVSFYDWKENSYSPQSTLYCSVGFCPLGK